MTPTFGKSLYTPEEADAAQRWANGPSAPGGLDMTEQELAEYNRRLANNAAAQMQLDLEGQQRTQMPAEVQDFLQRYTGPQQTVAEPERGMMASPPPEPEGPESYYTGAVRQGIQALVPVNQAVRTASQKLTRTNPFLPSDLTEEQATLANAQQMSGAYREPVQTQPTEIPVDPGSISDSFRGVGRAAGGLASPERAESMGKVFQGFAEGAPALVAMAPLGLAGQAAAFGAMSAADSAERGDPLGTQLAHGAVGTAVGAALGPGGRVGNVLGEGALRAATGEAVVNPLTVMAASKAGHVAVSSLLMETQRQADSLIETGQAAPLTPESIVGVGLNTIPFAAFPSELSPIGERMKAQYGANKAREDFSRAHADVWTAMANGEDITPSVTRLSGLWNRMVQDYNPTPMEGVLQASKIIKDAETSGRMNDEDYLNLMKAFQGKYSEKMLGDKALPGPGTLNILVKKGWLKPMTREEIEGHFDESLKFHMGDYNAAKIATANKMLAHAQEQIPAALEEMRKGNVDIGESRTDSFRRSEADKDAAYNAAMMKLIPFMKDAVHPKTGENLLTAFINRDIAMSTATAKPSMASAHSAWMDYDAYKSAIIKLAETYNPEQRKGVYNPLMRMANGKVQEREQVPVSIEDMVMKRDDGKWEINPQERRKLGQQGGTALSRAQEFVVDRFSPDAERGGQGMEDIENVEDPQAFVEEGKKVRGKKELDLSDAEALSDKEFKKMFETEADEQKLTGEERDDYIVRREEETRQLDNSLGVDLAKQDDKSYYDIALHLMEKVSNSSVADLWAKHGGRPLFGAGATSPGKFQLFKLAILADMEKNIDPGTKEQASDHLSKAQIEFYNAWRANATEKGERPPLAESWKDRRAQFRHALRVYWGQGNINMREFYRGMLADQPEYLRILDEPGRNGPKGPGLQANVVEGRLNDFDFSPQDVNRTRPVVGNKKAWFTPENTALYRGLLNGTNRVVDAFMGSGAMGSAARQLGFRGDILANERDPRVATALRTIKDNPGAIEDVRALVEKLQAVHTPEEFNAIVASWPNQNIAQFVGSQANFRGKALEMGKPVPDVNQKYNLKSLPERLARWKAQQHEVVSEDGFAMANKAGPGDLLVFDPPYLGTYTYGPDGAKTSGMANVEVALKNGAKVLYFNSYSPELERQAKDMGLITERQTVGKTDTLVAHSPVEGSSFTINKLDPHASFKEELSKAYGGNPVDVRYDASGKVNRIILNSGLAHEAEFAVLGGDYVASPASGQLPPYLEDMQRLLAEYNIVVSPPPPQPMSGVTITGPNHVVTQSYGDRTRDAMQVAYNGAMKAGLGMADSIRFANRAGFITELFKQGIMGVYNYRQTPGAEYGGVNAPMDHGGKMGRAVTVATDFWANLDKKNPASAVYHMLATLGHEIAHTWDRQTSKYLDKYSNLVEGPLDPARRAAHNELQALFATWTLDAQDDFVNNVVPSIMRPDTYEKHQSLVNYGDRGTETMSVFMGHVMNGIIFNAEAENQKQAPVSTYAEALKWTPDQMGLYAGFIHRDFGMYTAAIRDYYKLNPNAPGAAMIVHSLDSVVKLSKRYVDFTVAEIKDAQARVEVVGKLLDTSGAAMDPTYVITKTAPHSPSFAASTVKDGSANYEPYQAVVDEQAMHVFGDYTGQAPTQESRIRFEHEKKAGTQLPPWAKWGSLFYQQMMVYHRQGNPLAEMVMQKVNDLEKGYFRLNREMHNPFLVYDDKGRLTYDENHPLLRIVQRKDPMAIKAADTLSELARWSNDVAKPAVERDAQGKLSLSSDVPAGLSGKIGAYPNEVQQGILAGMDSLLKGSAKAADLLFNDRVESTGARLAAMMMSLDKGLTSDAAWNLAQNIVPASLVFARARQAHADIMKSQNATPGQMQNPVNQQAMASAQRALTEATLRFQHTLGGLNTDQIGAANAFLFGRESIAKDLTDLRDFFDKRKEWFTTESRPGQFFLASTMPNGEDHYVGAKNSRHMNQITDQLTAAGHTNIRYYDRGQPTDNTLFDTPDRIIQTYIDKEHKAWLEARALMEAKLSGSDMQFIDNLGYVPGAEISKGLESKGIKKYFMERERLPGREMTNSISAFVDYTGRLSGSVARRSLQRQMDLHMADPRLANEGDFKMLVKQNMDSLMQPLGDGWQLARTMLTARFLGAPNFIGPMVEMLQSAQSIMPYLIHESGFTSGVKYYKDALEGPYKYFNLGSDLASKRVLASAQAKHDANPRLLTKEEAMQLYYKRQNDEGGFQYGPIYSANNSRNHQLLTQMAFGLGASEPRTFKEMISDPIYWAAQKSMFLYSTASAYNSRIAFLGSLSMLYDKGLRGDELYKSAAAYQNAYTHGGGKPNSIGYVSIISNPRTRSAVGLTEALQRYAFGNTMMSMNFFDESMPADVGIGGLRVKTSSMRVTPEQRSNARKAFATSQAIQVALAGGMGLTGAGIISAMVQKWGGPDLKERMRLFWKDLGERLGLSEPHAVMMANFAQNGLVSNTLGIDVSNRMTTNSILGFNSFDGFNTSEIPGVASSAVQDLWDTTKFVSQGNLVEAGKSLAPPSWRPYANLAESQMRYGDWGVRNQQGHLQATLDPKEVPGYLLGAKPYSMKMKAENKQAIKYAEQRFTQDRGQTLDTLAQQLQKGNSEAMWKFIEEQRAKDPTLDAQSIKAQVAQRAYNMTHEEDPMARGFPAGFGPQAQEIDASFGHPSAPQSLAEEKVYMLQHGAGGTATPHENIEAIKHAQTIDAMVKNRGMTRDEAERMLRATQKTR